MSGPSGAGSGRGWIWARSRRTSSRSRTGRLSGLLIALVALLLMPAAAAAIDEYPVPPGSNPGGITAGPDGALWFLAEGTSTIYRMTTAGALDPPAGFPVPITGTDSSLKTLDQMTVGPDGALVHAAKG